MFVFVALKAAQQLNVMERHRWRVMPTSLAMSAFEVYVISTVVTRGFSLALVLCIGVGAGLGCLFTMSLYDWIDKRKNSTYAK